MKLHLKILIAVLALAFQQAEASLYKIGGTYTGNDRDLDTYTWKIDGETVTGLVGAIKFIPQGTTGGTVFASVCLDVNADLVLGRTYTFSDAKTFSEVGQGSNPKWGNVNGNDNALALQALQNAAYIFYTYQSWLNGHNVDEKAAVQLAIWSALYNTGGTLTANGAGNRFSVTGGDATGISLANQLLGNLPPPGTPVSGYVYQPLNRDGSIDTGAQEIFAPPAVPEPATIFAGSLLLLPFAVSVIRRLRRNCAE